MTIILFLGHLFFLLTQTNTTHAATRWIVESNSSLNIEGRSNISSFSCEVTRYVKADTLVFFKDETGRQLVFTNSALTIDINGFDCHQRFITSDFRKTLKADQSHFLKIHFITMDAFDPRNHQQVKGRVEIALAGVVKSAVIDFTANPTGGGRIQMVGTKKLMFSDFNLTPPRKLAGFVRIEEEITVNFQLFFRTIE